MWKRWFHQNHDRFYKIWRFRTNKMVPWSKGMCLSRSSCYWRCVVYSLFTRFLNAFFLFTRFWAKTVVDLIAPTLLLLLPGGKIIDFSLIFDWFSIDSCIFPLIFDRFSSFFRWCSSGFLSQGDSAEDCFFTSAYTEFIIFDTKFLVLTQNSSFLIQDFSFFQHKIHHHFTRRSEFIPCIGWDAKNPAVPGDECSIQNDEFCMN